MSTAFVAVKKDKILTARSDKSKGGRGEKQEEALCLWDERSQRTYGLCDKRLKQLTKSVLALSLAALAIRHLLSRAERKQQVVREVAGGQEKARLARARDEKI